MDYLCLGSYRVVLGSVPDSGWKRTGPIHVIRTRECSRKRGPWVSETPGTGIELNGAREILERE